MHNGCPDKIHLDKEHPNLKNRYLDLRFLIDSFDDEECSEDSEFEVAIEFKFSRINYTDEKKEKKRIFNDIMRLKLFIESNPKNRKAYFLICGPQFDFIRSFQSIGWNIEAKNNSGLPKEDTILQPDYLYSSIKPSGFYTDWFKFKKGETQQIDLNTTNDYLKGIYNDFYADYEDAYKDSFSKEDLRKNNPITKAIYISETSDLLDIPAPMKVGIWEICFEKKDE